MCDGSFVKQLKKYRVPYFFIMPFFILFLVFQLIPTIWTFYISMTSWKGIGTPKYCGFQNYQKMIVDNMFWESLFNTLIYWISGLVFILILSLFLASLLNSTSLVKGKSMFKTAVFLPYVCAAIAVGMIFKMLFDENVGLVNEVLLLSGIKKIPWLTNSKMSKFPVIILILWRFTPWFTMIIYSGLLNIPKDYYEAASIDGGGILQQFFYITLPSLKNILFFCSITITVDMWKLFNESYILAGPGTSNTSLFQYMYESGFGVFNMGYASAIGVILIAILVVLSIIQFFTRRGQGEL